MERLSISLPDQLARDIREAALAGGAGVSAWLARAAETQLLLERAAETIRTWEEVHGEITADEMARAQAEWPA